MGTNFHVKMTVQSVSGRNVTCEEQNLVRQTLKRFDADEVLDAVKPQDVGKWDWTECLASMCKNPLLSGLAFMVTWVSERGEFGFEYYAAEVGLVHRETPRPNFNGKWVYDAIRKRKEEEEAKAKSADDVKTRALSKLSKEERAALGL